MKPIPKALLIHKAILQEEIPGKWGTDGLKTIAELSRVRIEPSSRVIRDKNNAELQLAALLFFDCKNSRPRDQTFAEDQIVDFMGQKHRIVSVEPLYDEKKLHHYEIGMVRYVCKSEDRQTESLRSDQGSW